MLWRKGDNDEAEQILIRGLQKANLDPALDPIVGHSFAQLAKLQLARGANDEAYRSAKMADIYGMGGGCQQVLRLAEDGGDATTLMTGVRLVLTCATEVLEDEEAQKLVSKVTEELRKMRR